MSDAKEDTREEATVYEWLDWFYCHADFGPADEDVRYYLKKEFEQKTGKRLPKGYRSEE